MASLAGRNGGIENGLAYTATKAGVIGITRGMATRLAKYSVNCNAVCPGTTETAILSSFTGEKIDKLKAMIPLGRLGSVEDVANAVCFLCSKEAEFITGVALDVNGGMYIG
jgi:3-oxoacyl-[acyl-carrier protein] reductase